MQVGIGETYRSKICDEESQFAVEYCTIAMVWLMNESGSDGHLYSVDWLLGFVKHCNVVVVGELQLLHWLSVHKVVL